MSDVYSKFLSGAPVTARLVGEYAHECKRIDESEDVREIMSSAALMARARIALDQKLDLVRTVSLERIAGALELLANLEYEKDQRR